MSALARIREERHASLQTVRLDRTRISTSVHGRRRGLAAYSRRKREAAVESKGKATFKRAGAKTNPFAAPQQSRRAENPLRGLTSPCAADTYARLSRQAVSF
jgi:hypothetical protein